MLTALLAVSMLASMSVPAFATDDAEYSTTVKYTGADEGKEYFTLTVPATMAPGETEDVTLKGLWSSAKTYTVTADETVEMKSNLGNNKTLNVTFDGISLAGDDAAEVVETTQVSVENMTMRLGVYEGTFNYNITISGSTGSGYNDSDEIDNPQTIDAGLYSDGEMLASWDELVSTYGLDIEKDYFSDDFQTAGSGYYVLTNNFGSYNSLELVISDSVASIGGNVFSDCGFLVSVTIPNSIASIGVGAFEDCISLTSVTIPCSITSIEDYMFAGCTSLTSVTIPYSVKSIGSSAFSKCKSLTSIDYSGTQVQWKAIAFESGWYQYTGDFTIHCTDGDIAK